MHARNSGLNIPTRVARIRLESCTPCGSIGREPTESPRGIPGFSRAICWIAGKRQAGEAVLVVDPGNAALGTAHYSSASQISLRMLSDRVETIDRAFLSAAHRAGRGVSQTRGGGFRGLSAGAWRRRSVAGPGDRPLRRLLHRADAGSGHGSRQGRDRELPGGAVRAARNRGAERRCGSEARSAAARVGRAGGRCSGDGCGAR